MNFTTRGLKWVLLLSIPLAFWQCDKDDDGTATLGIEITDAPVDDASIQGVFVTVSKVYVDGKEWNGLTSKQTINVMSLQNGAVYNLGSGEIDAGSYDRISLVLDLQSDENGTSPGCYVMKGGQKHNLASTTGSEITIEVSGDGDVMKETTGTAIVDFDLRKSLRYGNSTAPSSDYSFGTNSELNAAMRFVEMDRAGKIQGHCTDLISTSDKIVVYAYQKGEFNRQQEVNASSDEQFTHAVTSTAVDAQGNYTLAWLEDGKYELVFASYKDEGSNGTMDLQGTLNLDSILELDLTSVDVGVSTTVTVDVIVTGILPL